MITMTIVAAMLVVVVAQVQAKETPAVEGSVQQQLHAVGGNCTSDPSQQGWQFDSADDTIKFQPAAGAGGCLSEPPNWNTLSELVVVPCKPGEPKQNFSFDAATGLVRHGTNCLALNLGDKPDSALRLEISGCGGRYNPHFQSPKELFAAANGSALRTNDGLQCVSATPGRPTTWPPKLYDLWTGHDAYTPRGIYRIPSMITTNNGTLVVFAQARVHSTDATPSSVVMRRSFDDGESWEPTHVVLPDYFNATEQVGESLYDPATDTIFFFENHVDFRIRHPGCSTCALWQMSSTDHGLTWTNQTVIKLADPNANQTEPWGGGNRTFGGGLASGIALKGGTHKGRLLAALRHDCGCNDQPASFVVYSDDHGQTWTGGALLPEAGEHGMHPGPPNQTNGARGGWTECEVAELKNGSVLLTSRNLYNSRSGLAGRMFARSDDGGANWASVWSAVNDPQIGLTSTYCEGSIVGVPEKGVSTLGSA
eukprot:SAG31_NODE_4207_length_3473_cov_3.916716_1_plen_481_part_00